MRDITVSRPLLAWYDRHARDLPWRLPPGSRAQPDPYRVWLSEIMLQQTTVAAVRDYFARFTALWPDVEALARAPEERVMAEWAGLGYYARARNLIACAREVAARGSFPDSYQGLIALPGIGPYTAAAIAAIAYDQPETVIDGNVERVTARLFALRDTLPGARPRLRELAETLTPTQRPGDFAQAMMDLGATICTPRKPVCALCPLNADCAGFAQGIAETLPAKAPKAPKPSREGIAWVGLWQGALVLERRPAKGLLGGTLAFPSSGWDGREMPPPGPANWQEAGTVRHVFTHFALEMTVMTGQLTAPPERGALHNPATLNPTDLPGLMRKVWERAQPALPPPMPD